MHDYFPDDYFADDYFPSDYFGGGSIVGRILSGVFTAVLKLVALFDAQPLTTIPLFDSKLAAQFVVNGFVDIDPNVITSEGVAIQDVIAGQFSTDCVIDGMIKLKESALSELDVVNVFATEEVVLNETVRGGPDVEDVAKSKVRVREVVDGKPDIGE